MFYPRGSTKLVDTLYTGGVQQNARIIELEKKYGKENVTGVMVIWTDGDDNMSINVTEAMVHKLLSDIGKMPRRTILFTAANQDAIKVGARYGVCAAELSNNAGSAGWCRPNVPRRFRPPRRGHVPELTEPLLSKKGPPTRQRPRRRQCHFSAPLSNRHCPRRRRRRHSDLVTPHAIYGHHSPVAAGVAAAAVVAGAGRSEHNLSRRLAIIFYKNSSITFSSSLSCSSKFF